MFKFHQRQSVLSLCLTAIICLSAQFTFAQGTTAFTYQGRLNDGGTVANGTFDLQFTLWDALASGNQIPAGSPITITKNAVLVTNGVFTVPLDFTAAAFPGADRYLEISVKHPADSSFTLLAPRQPVTATPYALRSVTATAADGLSATCVGCVSDTHIAALAGSKLTGAIPIAAVPAGSASYIQNGTTPQIASFNITGNGAVEGLLSADSVSGVTVSAALYYNLGGQRIIRAPNGNLFVGVSSGDSNTVGTNNAFFGSNAGAANTSGGFNSFFGVRAGNNVTTGSGNVFIGNDTGLANTTGSSNTLIGSGASVSGNLSFATAIGSLATAYTDNTIVLGRSADTVQIPGLINAATQYNIGGERVLAVSGGGTNSNTFAGVAAGANTTPNLNGLGNFNSFFGHQAGAANTTGLANAFVGESAGQDNTTGSSNTMLGSAANVGSSNLVHATAIGAGAVVSTNNTITLGRSTGADSVQVPGQISAEGGIILNGSALRLRGAADSNHSINYDSTIDGIRFTAFDQFQWARANGNTRQMILRGDGVLETRSGFRGNCFSGLVPLSNVNCNQDLAETFRTREQTAAGDVVTLIPQDHERPTVRRALRAYDEHLVGVVSSNPGLVFDEGDTKLAGANDKYITADKTVVAAVGRVPVKFTLENGAINVGDPLTSSATEPGKAMKATGAGKIIGIALESSAKAKDGMLLLWLQVGHYAPPQQLEEFQTIKAENAELKARTAAIEAQLSTILTHLAQGENKDNQK